MGASKRTLREVRAAMRARATSDICLSVPTARQRADGGCNHGAGMRYWRDVCVESDGDVLARDSVSGHYTRHHDLTDAEVAEARRLASLVREGTHYVAAGIVVEKGRTA